MFDVSLHGFPASMKKTCQRHWSPLIAARIERLESIRFSNPQFELETLFTREDFTRILVERFRIERARVEQFFAELARMDFFSDSGETTAQLRALPSASAERSGLVSRCWTAVFTGFGTPDQRAITAAHPGELLAGYRAEFAAGSLLPKVIAASDYATATGKPAVIDAPRGKGHILLLASNPFWRGNTQGMYSLVMNAVMNWDRLGR